MLSSAEAKIGTSTACLLLHFTGQRESQDLSRFMGFGKTLSLDERKLEIHTVKGVVRERCEKL